MVLGFVFVGAEMPEGAVGAAGVVERFDVVEHGEAGLVAGAKHVLCFDCALSMRALSQRSPTWPMLGMMPASRRVRPTKTLPYSLPRSEWWITPGGGLRRATAIAIASVTSSASSVSRIDQPTIRRL